MSDLGPAEHLLDPALRALVRLSAGVSRGADADLAPLMEEVAREAPPEAVEEVLLQTYLFLGYPAALNALAVWRVVSGRSAPDPLPGTWREWVERGEAVCREVYGGAYPDLRSNIGRLSPEMDGWMVTEGYGKVLGRPGLLLWWRECCIVAILAVLGTAPQLRSHLRGALRTGAPVEVVRMVLEEALRLAPEARRPRARRAWEEVLNRWERT